MRRALEDPGPVRVAVLGRGEELELRPVERVGRAQVREVRAGAGDAVAHEVAERRRQQGHLHGEREEALLRLLGAELVDRLDVRHLRGGNVGRSAGRRGGRVVARGRRAERARAAVAAPESRERADERQLRVPVGDALRAAPARRRERVEELVGLRVAEAAVEREEPVEERRARPRQADDEDGRAAHFGPPRQAPRRGDDAEPHLEAPHEVVEGDEAADGRRPRLVEPVDGEAEERGEGGARAPVVEARAPLRGGHERRQGQRPAQHEAHARHADAEAVPQRARQPEEGVGGAQRRALAHGDGQRAPRRRQQPPHAPGGDERRAHGEVEVHNCHKKKVNQKDQQTLPKQ